MPGVSYGELIGCDQLHYAIVTADTAAAYTTGAQTYLAPLAEIQIDAKEDVAVRYYDNVPMFINAVESNTEIKATVSGVPASVAAVLTGKPYDSVHGVVVDTGDLSNTPYCTLSGRMQLGDGFYRFFQYLKGIFTLGAMKAASKTDKIKENTYELTYTAVVTNYQFTMPDASVKGIKGIYGDTSDTAFATTFPTTASFFAQTQTPLALGVVSAVVLSTSVPAAGATAVVATAPIVLTFNNAIASDKVIVMKALDNTIVACTKAYNAAGKILTITPTSALTSAGVYYIVVDGVVDVYGQALAPVINKFTCA